MADKVSEILSNNGYVPKISKKKLNDSINNYLKINLTKKSGKVKFSKEGYNQTFKFDDANLKELLNLSPADLNNIYYIDCGKGEILYFIKRTKILFLGAYYNVAVTAD